MISSDLLQSTITALGYDAGEGLVVGEEAPELSARGFVWQELHSRGGAQAAYFSGGVPLVAFSAVSDADEADRLHRRLWNLGRVPLLIATDPEQTTAFSCFMGPLGDQLANPAVLRQASNVSVSEALADFSRFSVETGRAAQVYERQFRRNDRVDRRLLDNLRALRRALTVDGGRHVAVDALIGRAIFIRYFEDRGILTPEHLREFTPQESFLEVLASGAQSTYELFRQLAERFSGDVFAASEMEAAAVTDDDVAIVGAFLGGTQLASGQQAFWPYDFSIIPPELISSIYEQLLEERQGTDAAYYTPRPVVDLILDEVLPWSTTATTPRILDPACGSGIFLTEAFRRLSFRLGRAAGRPLEFDELSELLTSSIFGVDQNETAVGVAALGLYLALLENLDPPTAWREASLPPMVGTNLVASDFFEAHDLRRSTFDIVVGNPPWKSRLSNAASQFVAEHEIVVPDQQIAIAFLLGAESVLAPGGSVGLLLPAKPLLHNKSAKAVRARRALFRDIDVDTIIDLSILRRATFQSAIAPGAVLIGRRRAAPDESAFGSDADVMHVVPRGSPLQSSIDGFVISQGDVSRVPAHVAHESPDIWKMLTWGSMRDYELIQRLRRDHPSLKRVAADRDWFHSRGYQIAGGGEYDASHLVGRKSVPVEAVEPFHLRGELFKVVEASIMHRPRDPRLFAGPVVLFRRGLPGGAPAVAFSASGVTFNDSVVGLSARKRDAALLRLIVGYTNSSLGRYYHFLTAASWGVERDYIEGNEYLSMPIALPPAPLRQAVNKAVRSIEISGASPARLAALDDVVFAAFDLVDDEIDQVQDMLVMQLGQFQQGAASSAFKSPRTTELSAYTKAARAAMSDTVSSLKSNVWVSDAVGFYRVVTAGLTDRDAGAAPVRPGADVVRLLRQQVDEASTRAPSPAVIFQPSVMVLDGWWAHLVKPDEARYWTRSAARRDVADLLGAVATGATEPG